MPHVPPASWTVFLNGSYGVGKSATLEHVGDLLADAGHPFSLMDVDWFHRSWPPAAEDPDNVLVEAANIASVWARYRESGERQLVVSGVITGPADRERYERAVGMVVRLVRLEATALVTEARLRHRFGHDREHSLDWHLSRHRELAHRLTRADLDEAVVQTDDRTPREVARQVLTHFGLPGA